MIFRRLASAVALTFIALNLHGCFEEAKETVQEAVQQAFDAGVTSTCEMVVASKADAAMNAVEAAHETKCKADNTEQEDINDCIEKEIAALVSIEKNVKDEYTSECVEAVQKAASDLSAGASALTEAVNKWWEENDDSIMAGIEKAVDEAKAKGEELLTSGKAAAIAFVCENQVEAQIDKLVLSLKEKTEASTTLAETAEAGATEVLLKDGTGFMMGMKLTLGSSSPSAEDIVTLTSQAVEVPTTVDGETVNYAKFSIDPPLGESPYAEGLQVAAGFIEAESQLDDLETEATAKFVAECTKQVDELLVLDHLDRLTEMLQKWWDENGAGVLDEVNKMGADIISKAQDTTQSENRLRLFDDSGIHVGGPLHTLSWSVVSLAAAGFVGLLAALVSVKVAASRRSRTTRDVELASEDEEGLE